MCPSCRSLKLYFVLRQYGAESLREYLRHHMALAQWFGERVREDSRFELVAPVRFGLVCFRCVGWTHDHLSAAGCCVCCKHMLYVYDVR